VYLKPEPELTLEEVVLAQDGLRVARFSRGLKLRVRMQGLDWGVDRAMEASFGGCEESSDGWILRGK
jgi:hypothetical protein